MNAPLLLDGMSTRVGNLAAVPAWLNPFGEGYVVALRRLIAEHISERFRRSPTGDGTCAAAAEVSARIFQRARHEAFTLRCDAAFFNAAALACLQQQREVRSDPAAWSVAAVAPGYHAVVIIDRQFLFDPTSFQFNRPERGLLVPIPLVAPIEGAGVELALPSNGRAAYCRQPTQLEFNPALLVELRTRPVRSFIDHWAQSA